MLKTHYSLGAVLGIAAALFCLVCLASRQAVAGDATRPITSLTAEERLRLPDTTLVALPSGQTVTLGALRAAHRAREERFSRAAALGQMTSTKLAPPPPAAAAPALSRSTTTTTARSASGPAQGPAINPGAVPPGTQAAIMLQVPFQLPTAPVSGTIPKDYADFCKAAKGSACLYLPANATLHYGYTPKSPSYKGWFLEQDSLIDKGVCSYDGGVWLNSICNFYYPITQLVTFKPTGPLTTAAACNAPSQYVVDPKGALQTSYPYGGGTFTTGGAPITCVVTVWVGK